MTPDDESTYEVLNVGGERDSVDSTSESAEHSGGGAPRRRAPSGRLVGVGSLVLALVAGGAVYASARSGDTGEQPESVLPATAFAFAKVDLVPSGARGASLTEFVRRFPTARAQNADELREGAISKLTKSLHLDYATAIKPWLGRRAAIAGFPAAQGRPQWVAALQTNDPAAAKAALASAPKPPAVVQRGGYVVIAPDQPTLDAALAATGDSPLSKDPEFASDLARLAGSELAVSWLDSAKSVDALLYSLEHPAPGDGPMGADTYAKTMRAGAVGRTVLGLHAAATYAEIVGYTIGRTGAAGAGRPEALRTLPNTTIGGAFVADGAALLDSSGGSAFSAFGLFGRLPMMSFGLSSLFFMGGPGGAYSSSSASCAAPAASDGPASCVVSSYAASAVPSLSASAPSAPASAALTAEAKPSETQPAETQPAETQPAPKPSQAQGPTTECSVSPDGAKSCTEQPGLGTTEQVPSFEDPTAAFAKEFAGALTGGTTIALGSLPTPGSKRAPDLALIGSTKDSARAEALAAKAKATFGKQYTNDVFSQVKDGVLTIASDAKYAATMGSGGLGKTPLFETAMGPLGDQVELAVFVNLEGVRDVTPGYPKELLPVSAVGVSASRDGDVSVLRVRLVSR